MEHHSGEHPRIGAVDVAPSVPLASTTMDDAWSWRVLRRADRGAVRDPGLPLRARGHAAGAGPPRGRPSRWLRGRPRRVLAGGGSRSDFGPARTHARVGAVAVGARPFLIAWNINLDTDDVEVAKRIARSVRESGGGLPAVQGNGFFIEELDAAQVSMNLLDFERTPMWRVWDEVERLAAEEGVSPLESELIGLEPQAAFDAVAATRASPGAARRGAEARSAAAAGTSGCATRTADGPRAAPRAAGIATLANLADVASSGLRLIRGGRARTGCPDCSSRTPPRSRRRRRDAGRLADGRSRADRRRPAATTPRGGARRSRPGRAGSSPPARARPRPGAGGEWLPARPLRPPRRAGGTSRPA